MSLFRSTIGTALAGGAQALSVASKVMEATAKSLRPGARGTQDSAPGRDSVGQAVKAPSREPAPQPLDDLSVIDDLPVIEDGPEAGSDTAEVIRQLEEELPDLGRVVEPAPTPLLDETPHVRTSESHIEELAAKPVGQVVSAVADLSTDELRLLTEYEISHKNRRTVLTAIEKALAPDVVTPNSAG